MWNQRMYPNVCSTNLDTNPDISASGAELEDGDLESSKDLINHVCDYRHLASDSTQTQVVYFLKKRYVHLKDTTWNSSKGTMQIR